MVSRGIRSASICGVLFLVWGAAAASAGESEPMPGSPAGDSVLQAGSAEDGAEPMYWATAEPPQRPAAALPEPVMTAPVAEDPEAPPARGVSAILGEVTTARRESEKAQRVPVSVSAFTAKEVVRRDARRLADLEGAAPGLTVDPILGAANSTRLTIRGVSEVDSNPSADAAIGVYVDGVYSPRSQGLDVPLYDVDRVEVVRGPQGTLFGKNTIGGAINIVTHQPEFEFGGDASVRVGNFDRTDTRFTLNVPLVPERAAARLAIATNYDDGFQTNVVNGERQANDRLLAGRGQLLLLPTSNLEVLLSGEYARQDRKPEGSKCRIVGPQDPSFAQFSQVLGVDLRTPCAQDQASSDSKDGSDLSFQRDDLRQIVTSAQITWDLAETVSLRSITAYREQRNNVRLDSDGLPLNIAQPTLDAGRSEQDAFSQELQLTGFAFDRRVNYLLGGYAFHEEVDELSVSGVLPDVVLPGGLPVNSVLADRVAINNGNLALYGQLGVRLTDRLDLSVGLRRTVERKRLKKRLTSLNPSLFIPVPGTELLAGPLGTPAFERSERFSDFSPNASLSFQATPEILVYASYATGFRSGRFNGRIDPINRDFEAIDPEDLTTYEVGAKSTFYEDRLLLNVSTFYSVYEDIQRLLLSQDSSLSPVGLPVPVVRVTNAAEARLQGVELELIGLPLPGLRLETTASAFHSRYIDFDDPSATFGNAFRNLKDSGLPGQPDYLVSFAVNYEFGLGAIGTLDSRVQWTLHGEQANDVQDSRATRTGSYGLLDARLGLQLPDGKTEIVAFGSNLLNRSYFNNALDGTSLVGFVSRFQGSPRRYGVELRRSF